MLPYYFCCCGSEVFKLCCRVFCEYSLGLTTPSFSIRPNCFGPRARPIHSFVHSFIHSGHFYSVSSSSPLLRGAPDYSTDTVSEFHAEAPQATAGKGLAQGPYVAARAGVEPTTLRLKVIVSTKAPPCPMVGHGGASISIFSIFNYIHVRLYVKLPMHCRPIFNAYGT